MQHDVKGEIHHHETSTFALTWSTTQSEEIMTTIMCIPSPPFGAHYWTSVCKRLETKQLQTIVTPLSTASGLAQATRTMDDALSSCEDDVVLLTHGAMLSLAMALTSHPRIKGSSSPTDQYPKHHLGQTGKSIPTSVLKWYFNPTFLRSVQFVSGDETLGRQSICDEP